MTATVLRPRFTATERSVLKALGAAGGRLVSNQQLQLAVWRSEYVSDSAVRVQLLRIRKKLPAGVDIETVWGRGYRLKGTLDPEED